MFNREFIENTAGNLLDRLYKLPGVVKIGIKDIELKAADDEDNIKKGLEACYHDILSDVDFLVTMVRNRTELHSGSSFIKNTLAALGIKDEIFGYSFQGTINEKGGYGTLRICLKSGFRTDIVCNIKADEDVRFLERSEIQSQDSAEEETDLIKKDQADSDIYDKLEEKTNNFWFSAVLALTKLLREDYLIAAHLTSGLIMEGLVLQMIERDQVLHMNFHRYGHREEIAYLKEPVSDFESFWLDKDYAFQKIASDLSKAVIAYDRLAKADCPDYDKRREIFFDLWRKYTLKG